MTPILIVKTRKGYAMIPYTGELPQFSLIDIEVFDDLTGTYGQMSGGVFGALREHFTPPTPEGASE